MLGEALALAQEVDENDVAESCAVHLINTSKSAAEAAEWIAKAKGVDKSKVCRICKKEIDLTDEYARVPQVLFCGHMAHKTCWIKHIRKSTCHANRYPPMLFNSTYRARSADSEHW